jgi:hypothetical protein
MGLIFTLIAYRLACQFIWIIIKNLFVNHFPKINHFFEVWSSSIWDLGIQIEYSILHYDYLLPKKLNGIGVLL